MNIKQSPEEEFEEASLKFHQLSGTVNIVLQCSHAGDVIQPIRRNAALLNIETPTAPQIFEIALKALDEINKNHGDLTKLIAAEAMFPIIFK